MRQLHNDECNKIIGQHKISDEILGLQQYENRLSSYERLITNIIRNNDKAKQYTIEAMDEQKKLLEQNALLRKKAAEAGLDLEQIAKENEEEDAQKILAQKKKEK